jgi:O-Antigen ligase
VDPLLLTIGAAAVLVWAGIVLARGSLVGTALLLLLAGSCLSSPFFHILIGHAQLTLDRLLLVVLLAQYAIYRHWGTIEARRLASADFLLGTLLLVLLLGTLLHDYRADRWQPMSGLLGFYVMPAVLYWMVRQSEWTARTASSVLLALAAFGVYLCITAAAETHGVWQIVVPKYIVSPAFGDYLGRGRGPFLNSAATGLVATLGMCAAAACWPRASWLGRLIVLLLLPIYAVGIYSTFSESAWWGGGAALAAMAVLAAPRAWRVRVLAATVVAATIAVTLGWQHLPALKRHALDAASTAAESAPWRTIDADVAWQMFSDRPILGCGLGQLGRELPAYLEVNSVSATDAKAERFLPRNVFVELLLETGILGAGLFAAVLGTWVVIAWRLWNSTPPSWLRQVAVVFLAWMPAYLVGAMFHNLAIVAMVNMFLLFMGGAVMGAAAVPVVRQRRTSIKPYVPEEELAYSAW